MIRAESMKPNPKSGLPSTPIVNDGTTMFAASHWVVLERVRDTSHGGQDRNTIDPIFQ